MAERTPWSHAAESAPWFELAVRPSICWWIIGAAVASFAAFGAVAAWMTPPATAIADDDFTIAAILAASGVIVWVFSCRSFSRWVQLATFLALVMVCGAWSSAREWNHQRQSDYSVKRQNQQLRLNAIQLSGNTINFLRERRRVIPPPPAAATWDADSRAIRRFEAETARMFEAKFGRDVRTTHDLMAVRNLRDKELDMVYRRPADEFQIQTIAIKLAALASKLER